MRGYIHNHATFDQIIPDQTETSNIFSMHNRKFMHILRTKKGKPFWLNKKQTQHHPMIISTDFETQHIQKKQSSNSSNSFQESYYESIKNTIMKTILSSSSSHTLRDQELSLRESLSVQQTHKRTLTIDDRYQRNSKNTGVWSKSSFQLQRQNQKLLRNIKKMQSMNPQLHRNQQIIKSQNKFLLKVKKKSNLLEDVAYQFHLDKKNQKTKRSSRLLNKVVSERKSIIKKQQVKLLSTKIDKEKGSPKKEGPPRQYQIIHEDYLYKRRQQDLNNDKLRQLDEKIEFYKDKLEEMTFKQRILSYEGLNRRLIFLKYDIERNKQQFHEIQQNLLCQVGDLKEQLTQTQRQILQKNKQIRQKHQNKIDQQNKSVSFIRKSPNFKRFKTQQSPKSKIFNFFHKNK